MAQRLPVDVYERILAHLVDEPELRDYPSEAKKAAYRPFDKKALSLARDLAACARVCRAWSYAVQQTLFRVVTLLRDGQPYMLLPHLQARPDLARKVHYLAVDSAAPHEALSKLVKLLSSVDTYHLDLYSALPTNVGLPTASNKRLRSLAIRGSIGPIKILGHAPSSLPHSIRQLHLKNIMLSPFAVFSLPNLQELYIDGQTLLTVQDQTFKSSRAIQYLYCSQAAARDAAVLIRSIGLQITYLQLVDPESVNLLHSSTPIPPVSCTVLVLKVDVVEG